MNFGWDAPENLKKKKVRKDIHDEENHMNTQVNKNQATETREQKPCAW